MLTVAQPKVHMVGIAVASALSLDASQTALAGAALDQTLAMTPNASAAQCPLVVLSGCAFKGAPNSRTHPGSLAPLLDNEFGAAACRQLLLDRGLLSTQLFGVFLAEGTPFLSAVQVGCGFMATERLPQVLVVAIDGEHANTTEPAAVGSFASAAACLLTVETIDGLWIERLLRSPAPSRARTGDHAGDRKSLSPNGVERRIGHARLADRIHSLLQWQRSPALAHEASCLFIEQSSESWLAAHFERVERRDSEACVSSSTRASS